MEEDFLNDESRNKWNAFWLEWNDRTGDYEAFHRVHKSRITDPFDLLALELLRDAIMRMATFKGKAKPSHKERVIYQETVEWVRSEDNEYVFSFVYLCDRYGLDAGAVRKQLLSSDHVQLRRMVSRSRVRVMNHATGRYYGNEKKRGRKKVNAAKETNQRPVRCDWSEEECDDRGDTPSLSREVETVAS